VSSCISTACLGVEVSQRRTQAITKTNSQKYKKETKENKKEKEKEKETP
jgi:hypothetical protein